MRVLKASENPAPLENAAPMRQDFLARGNHVPARRDSCGTAGLARPCVPAHLSLWGRRTAGQDPPCHTNCLLCFC